MYGMRWERRLIAVGVMGATAALTLLTTSHLTPHISQFFLTTDLARAASSPASGSSLSGKHCDPRHSVMFLKTHKCASSTTQRIFFRYGKKHGLTMALPATGNYLGSPSPFKAAMIPASLRSPDDTYNMMLIHTRLDVEALTKVMKKDSAWVTIVREPIDQLLSLWSYLTLQQFYKMSLEQFADMPYSEVVRWRHSKRFGIHQMFFDMGYGSVEDYQAGELTQKVKRLNEVFDLVMITERYDESLVLLKHLMCWTTEDVTYLSINGRKEYLKRNISEKTREKLLHLSQPDVVLYDFFYKIFEQKVEEFGRERMQREVQELKEANERLRRMCVVESTSPDKVTDDMNWMGTLNKWSVKDNQTCVDLARTELSFVDEVRERQMAWVMGGWRQNLSQLMMQDT